MENNKTHTTKTSSHLILSKVAGIAFILLATFIVLNNECLSNGAYFIIYALVGIGTSLLFIKSAEKSKIEFKGWNVSVILIGSVALPFILFFGNPIGRFKTDKCDLISVTVFVHGKGGKQDIILRQKGYVIMDVRGERKRSSINENGQAFFQNLHVNDSVQIDIDFSEPYKTINSDSMYVIEPNSNIYLPVMLQGIDNVNGMVIYNDEPLSGVIVKLEGKTSFLLDTTNQTGDYNFTIPEQMQLNKYQVWFIKQGFRTKLAPAFPQTGEHLNIVMEKK